MGNDVVLYVLPVLQLVLSEQSYLLWSSICYHSLVVEDELKGLPGKKWYKAGFGVKQF